MFPSTLAFERIIRGKLRSHREPASLNVPRRLTRLRLHAYICQIFPQLVQHSHLDGMHPQLGGTFEIRRSIVDEATLIGRELGQFESYTIDIGLGLAQADKARTHEHAEDPTQSEFLDSKIIEFARLIVNRSHEVLA